MKLSRDEFAFLIGHLIQTRWFRRKGAGQKLSMAELRGLMTLARRPSATLNDVAGVVQDHEDRELFRVVQRFNPEGRERSIAYATGRAFLDLDNPYIATLGLPGYIGAAVLRRSRMSAKKKFIQKRNGKYETGPKNEKENQALLRDLELDTDDHDIATDVETEIGLIDDVLDNGPETFGELEIGDLDLADMDGAVPDIADLEMQDVSGNSDARQANLQVEMKRRYIEDWLAAHGARNSGVNINPYVERFARVMKPDDVSSAFNALECMNFRKAIEIFERAANKANLPKSMSILLFRLLAVITYADSNLALPDKAQQKQYEPVSDMSFYLVHMRGPFESNGYVSRSMLVLKSLAGAGIKTMPFTRLGFPNDLTRHRDARIPATQEFGGFVFHTLSDDKNGVLNRPIDEYVAEYASRIETLAHQHRPGVIHAASNHLNGLAAVVAARRLGIPSIYEVRGIWEFTQLSSNPQYSQTLIYKMRLRLELEAMRAADLVVAISSQVKDFIVSEGVDESKVRVLPNCVDVNQFTVLEKDLVLAEELKISPDSMVVGYIGSLVAYEGLNVVIEAIAKLVKEGVSNIHLLVVGDGKVRADLQELCFERGIQTICHFAGRVPHDQVRRYYSLVDVAPFARLSSVVTELVPPLKPFEAMAMSKAVVVSDVAALKECIIEGETGLVAEANSADAMADALQRLYADPNLRKRLGENAMEWVRRERSTERMSAIIREIYDELL